MYTYVYDSFKTLIVIDYNMTVVFTFLIPPKEEKICHSSFPKAMEESSES